MSEGGDQAARLRARAEAALPGPAGEGELEATRHELSVHRAELVMQNEALRDAQAALEESRRRWFELFERAPVAYLTVAREGAVHHANAAAEALLGPRSVLRGRALVRLAAIGQEVNLHRLAEEAWAGAPTRRPLELRSTSGRQLQVEACASAVDTPAGALLLLVLLEVPAPREAAILERLEALGLEARTVAHDLNNLLAVVLGGASLGEEAHRAQPAEAAFAELAAAARLGRALTARLLATARRLAPPPAEEAPPPPAAGPGAAGAAATARHVALVVDDEPSVARTLRRLLQSRGWEVELAATGPEALTAARDHGARIGVVILDLLLPGMGGLEVLAGLRQLHPALPVLVLSGVAEVALPAELAAPAITGALSKPFEPSALEAELARLTRAGVER